MIEDAPPFVPGYWWTMGLETEAGWTKSPIAVEFLGDQYWLRPAIDTAQPDISVGAPDYSDGSTHFNKIRKLLSLLCWFDQRRMIESTGMGSGGPRPVRVGNMEASNIKPHYETDFPLRIEMLPTVPSNDAWLGLALYREALGLNSVPYKVLGFLKIINIRYANGLEQKQYINGALPFITGHFASPRLAMLQAEHADVGEYLYASCRCAVAHASTHPLVNPDDSNDLERLHADVTLIQALAEHFIEHELGVKSHSTILREHRYHTDGFRTVLTDGVIGAVKAGLFPPHSSIRIPNVDVRVRGNGQRRAFANMTVTCVAFENGKIRLRLCSISPPKSIVLNVTLDFTAETLLFEPLADMFYTEPTTADEAQAEIDYLEIQKALLFNGILEIYAAGETRRLGRLDPYLPNNIVPSESARNIDATIAALKTKFLL